MGHGEWSIVSNEQCDIMVIVRAGIFFLLLQFEEL